MPKRVWQCPRCGQMSDAIMTKCAVCKKARDGRVEIFTLAPPAVPKPRVPRPEMKSEPELRTDPDLFAKRREKAEKEQELLKWLLDEVSEVSRISHATIEKAKLEPDGKLLDPKAQSIEVPNTWWGWLLVAFLAAVIVGAAIITGKSLLK